MDEYIKQAEDFLADNNATIEINFREKVYSPWGDNQWHNAYDVTIMRNDEEFTVDFNSSAYDTQYDTEPCAYDILACLTKYDPEEYWDFCEMYGYDNSKKSWETYQAVVEEYSNVLRLFGDCMEELREIE